MIIDNKKKVPLGYELLKQGLSLKWGRNLFIAYKRQSPPASAQGSTLRSTDSRPIVAVCCVSISNPKERLPYGFEPVRNRDGSVANVSWDDKGVPRVLAYYRSKEGAPIVDINLMCTSADKAILKAYASQTPEMLKPQGYLEVLECPNGFKANLMPIDKVLAYFSYRPHLPDALKNLKEVYMAMRINAQKHKNLDLEWTESVSKLLAVAALSAYGQEEAVEIALHAIKQLDAKSLPRAVLNAFVQAIFAAAPSQNATGVAKGKTRRNVLVTLLHLFRHTLPSLSVPNTVRMVQLALCAFSRSTDVALETCNSMVTDITSLILHLVPMKPTKQEDSTTIARGIVEDIVRDVCYDREVGSVLRIFEKKTTAPPEMGTSLGLLCQAMYLSYNPAKILLPPSLSMMGSGARDSISQYPRDSMTAVPGGPGGGGGGGGGVPYGTLNIPELSRPTSLVSPPNSGMISRTTSATTAIPTGSGSGGGAGGAGIPSNGTAGLPSLPSTGGGVASPAVLHQSINRMTSNSLTGRNRAGTMDGDDNDLDSSQPQPPQFSRASTIAFLPPKAFHVTSIHAFKPSVQLTLELNFEACLINFVRQMKNGSRKTTSFERASLLKCQKVENMPDQLHVHFGPPHGEKRSLKFANQLERDEVFTLITSHYKKALMKRTGRQGGLKPRKEGGGGVDRGPSRMLSGLRQSLEEEGLSSQGFGAQEGLSDVIQEHSPVTEGGGGGMGGGGDGMHNNININININSPGGGLISHDGGFHRYDSSSGGGGGGGGVSHPTQLTFAQQVFGVRPPGGGGSSIRRHSHPGRRSFGSSSSANVVGGGEVEEDDVLLPPISHLAFGLDEVKGEDLEQKFTAIMLLLCNLLEGAFKAEYGLHKLHRLKQDGPGASSPTSPNQSTIGAEETSDKEDSVSKSMSLQPSRPTRRGSLADIKKDLLNSTTVEVGGGVGGGGGGVAELDEWSLHWLNDDRLRMYVARVFVTMLESLAAHSDFSTRPTLLHLHHQHGLLLKRAILPAIVTCTASQVPSIFDLSLNAFTAVWKCFRSQCTAEVGAFLKHLCQHLLPSLYMSAERKCVILTTLVHTVFPNADALMEVYYNYDDDPKRITGEIVSTLCRDIAMMLLQPNEPIVEGVSMPTKAETSEGAKLRTHALAFLVHLLDVLASAASRAPRLNRRASRVAGMPSVPTMRLHANQRKRDIEENALRLAQENRGLKAIVKDLRESCESLFSEMEFARYLAHFLYKHSNVLDKSEIGDILSGFDDKKMLTNRQFLELRTAFIQHLDFSDLSFDMALRVFLCEGGFRLPGEAQKIDRLLESFCKAYCGENPGVFRHSGSALIAAFSMIMLNTDLHDMRLKAGSRPRQKMTLEQYLNNLRGVDEGRDFPRAFLTEMYQNIQASPIQWKEAQKAGSAGSGKGGNSGNNTGLNTPARMSPRAQSSRDLSTNVAAQTASNAHSGNESNVQALRDAEMLRVVRRAKMVMRRPLCSKTLWVPVPAKDQDVAQAIFTVIAPHCTAVLQHIGGRTIDQTVLNLCIEGCTNAHRAALQWDLPQKKQCSELLAHLKRRLVVVKLKEEICTVHSPQALIRDHRSYLKNIPNCLMASELVDWLIVNAHAPDVPTAVALGNELVKETGLLSTKDRNEEFKYGSHLFHFQPVLHTADGPRLPGVAACSEAGVIKQGNLLVMHMPDDKKKLTDPKFITEEAIECSCTLYGDKLIISSPELNVQMKISNHASIEAFKKPNVDGHPGDTLSFILAESTTGRRLVVTASDKAEMLAWMSQLIVLLRSELDKGRKSSMQMDK